MAKKYEYKYKKEEQIIEETRNKLNKITEQISEEKTVFQMIKDNPACSVITMLVIGILTALLSKKAVELILKMAAGSLKISTLLFVIKKSMPFLLKLKR